MRYWVYINDKVIERPFEEGELSSIQGFNANTLICKETPPAGEAQEWVPAKTLIAAFRAPVPPPPPAPGVISQFANKKEAEKKEDKVTILSSNIFASSSDNNEISIGGQTPYKMADITRTNVTANTENITENEQVSILDHNSNADKIYTEPATEILSLEEVEEFNADNQISSTMGNEEEVLKTAIRTLINKETVKPEDNTLQAIDIAKNKNIDLSDKPEEYFDGKVKKETQVAPVQEKKEEPKQEQPKQQEPAKQEAQPQQTTAPAQQEVQPQQQVQVQQTATPAQETIQNIALQETEPKAETQIEKQTPSVSEAKPNSSEVIITDVLQEFAKEKEEEKIEEALEEQEIQKAFSEEPVQKYNLMQELQPMAQNEVQSQEQPKVENLIPTQDNILEISTPQEDLKQPKTLEELTGPLPKQEENIMPQVVAASAAEQPGSAQVNMPNPNQQQEALSPEKDNFLTTFSSDIETVFLDQPTAFISDYIPPEETGRSPISIQGASYDAEPGAAKTEILDIRSDKGQHQVSLQNVRRIKPAAIKTVPMVEGQPINSFSNTFMKDFNMAEEAMAKVEKRNTYLNIFKFVGLILAFFVLVVVVLGIGAEVKIVNKDFSPFHLTLNKLIAKFSKNEEVKEHKVVSLEELSLQDFKEAQKLRINNIIQEVKDYKLIEGKTLGEKIQLLHPNDFDQLVWEASPSPTDQSIYAINISLPPNPEGYSPVNYRFHYNTVTQNLDAINSEANNILVKAYQGEDASPEYSAEVELEQ